ncbi:sodium:solute symporter [Aeoliella sp. ICT_H6.2]|uniref:Sodium:solute symporter n=1 Tax=Aeoliella straminimaris TaxID=2954799 RepID=A0A9X2FDJ1_9BACT|nr:sodium:solute symporter [Aeoliella straminimaris]
MSLPVVDLLVIAGYLLGVFGLGCWFVQRSRTTSGFMAAGGRLPGWAVGLSIFGTYLFSNTFLEVPGKAYGTNWNAFAFSLSLPLAAWIAVRWFVLLHRNSGSISAYDHLEKRFGPWARTYGLACYVLIQLVRVGAILFAVSLVLSTLTGWSHTTIIIAAGALVTIYTALGSIEAVIWTDVVQSIVLTTGAAILLLLMLFDMPEGPGQAVRVAAANDKFSLGSFSFYLTVSTFLVPLLYGLFENGKNFGIGRSYVQRYHASPSTKQAARSVWMGAMLYLPISAAFFAVGLIAYSYYQSHPELLVQVEAQVAQRAVDAGEAAPVMTDTAVGDSVLPEFIVYGLPVNATGLLIAAIFAAAMSSIDTPRNSSATVTLLDIYKRYLKPDCGEHESMAALHMSTAGMGAAGVAVALALIGTESVLDAWWTLSGIFSGALLGIFLLGVVSQRASRTAGLIGVGAGLLMILWLSLPRLENTSIVSLSASLRNPLHEHMTIVVGVLTVVLVGLAASGLTTKNSAPI